MTVRFVNEIALDWIFFKDEEIEVPTHKSRLAFFWLGCITMFSDLAFSVLIINYLMNTNASQREEQKVEGEDESENMIVEPPRTSINLHPKSNHYMEERKA